MVLAGPGAPASFSFSAGLTAHQNASGAIDFLDAKGGLVMALSAPAMVDAGHVSSGAISLQLVSGPQGLSAVVTPDAAWLASSSRKWPVTIDPDLAVNPTQDCEIVNGSSANTSFCTGSLLNVGYDGSQIHRALFQFDVSSIPTTANVLDGEFQVNVSRSSTPTWST